ncbi:MAG: hypoxanthine-guanine phosphoribosyltransferase [Tepidiphilus sp.]|nr:hypoxanthine-guanine phosphoribosyltransferase [Tepidiphilus sp.]MDK2796984.1 hypoxanthine phosphoribosyltransferase [Tepidiphilus sp.]
MNPKVEAMRRVLAEAECIADSAEVQRAIDRVAAEITEALAERDPLVYVVMKGAVVFAGQILPRLRFPLEVAYLHATRYHDTTAGSRLEWRVEPTAPIEGRPVLVLDDILDEGYTLAAVMQRLRDEGAEDVYLAVLCHKLHERKAYPGMRAHFTGLEIPDRYVFGYGMDYKGYWRNADGIYAVREA